MISSLGSMRIDNMDIACHDVETMVNFYHGILGLELLFPFEPGQKWAAVQAGDVTLYIFETANGDEKPIRTANLQEDPPGIDSFAFEVDDLDQAMSSLEGKVRWAADAERWDHPSGTWYRSRPFFDPEGNLLHVTEPHKA